MTENESKESKIIIPESLEQLLDGINLDTPYLDFYGKNFDKTAKKEWTASYIREDILRLINIYENSFFKNRQIGIEDYTLCALRRQLFLENKKRKNYTNAKMPIIRTFVDRLRKWISKANFSLKANPLSSEYKDTTEAVQTAISWCYSSAKGRQCIMQTALSAILNGNGYIKAQFKTPKEKIQSIQNPESKKYIKMDWTYAQMDWVSEFELFYDPTLDLKDQRYIVYRSIKPLKSILKMIETMDEKISPEHLNFIMKYPKPFSKRDYSQIRMIKYWGIEATKKWNNYSMDNLYNISFNNDKAEYCEIWTPDTLSICINGYIVADTVNPYRDREYRHPYYACHYAEGAGVSIGEWAWILLADIQKAYDALFNLLLDHASMAASPMIWVQAGKVIFNKKSVDHNLQWEPWWVLEMEDKGNMDFITPPALDQGIISTLQDMLEMANFSIAPTSYSDYDSQSRSAQDSQLRFEWLADTVALLVDSISNMLNEIAQNWIIDMYNKMPDLFEIPIFNSNWSISAWKKIKKEDLSGKYVFEWSSDSIADVNDLLKKSQIDQWLWYLMKLWMPGDGSTYLDVPKTLEYINELFKWPDGVIRNEKTYYSKFQEDQENKAEIQAGVQQIQANAEMEIQQQQAEIQQAMQQQQASMEWWQPMPEWQMPEQTQWTWEDQDVQALLWQMFS